MPNVKELTAIFENGKVMAATTKPVETISVAQQIRRLEEAAARVTSAKQYSIGSTRPILVKKLNSNPVAATVATPIVANSVAATDTMTVQTACGAFVQITNLKNGYYKVLIGTEIGSADPDVGMTVSAAMLQEVWGITAITHNATPPVLPAIRSDSDLYQRFDNDPTRKYNMSFPTRWGNREYVNLTHAQVRNAMLDGSLVLDNSSRVLVDLDQIKITRQRSGV